MVAPEYYNFTGRAGEVIPRYVTHVLIAKALKFVCASAFRHHPNIEEVICHDGVEKIEQEAFQNCPRLLKVIMPGVKKVGSSAFNYCRALNYIECGKLEIIGEEAFSCCHALRSIDLPSIKIVEKYAFDNCTKLTNAKFGKGLESLGAGAFFRCPSLERIALPLKDDMVAFDNTFRMCVKLNNIDLVEGVHETVAALLLEKWKNDINGEIAAINRILPNTPAGTSNHLDVGEKAQAIWKWIGSVLGKIVHYKAKHRRCLNVAAATLQPALPNDILLKSIFPFIELPSHTFQGED